STIRLMAGRELVSEGFRPGQVGSSAMPHKVNARSCERVAALRTVLDGHLAMAASLAGGQWNEGDVSCSAARRVMLPDAFFAADGLIQTILGVLEDLEVFPAMIAAELDRDLPLLATTRFLGAAVEAGLGREDAHELIRHHSVTAARARREGGPETGDADLVGRLADDPRFPLDRDVLERVLEDRSAYTGTAEVQIGRVVGRAREIVARHPAAARARARTRV
ncbi:MAG: adenylosuccinate lyase, partial [Acidimicrobiales bacterium]